MADRAFYISFRDQLNGFLGIFFWDFKRLDNTVYTFEILSYLYELREKENDSYIKKYLNKPLVILNVSIAECIMFDFKERIRQHSNERIPNLTLRKINNIKFRENRSGSLRLRDLRNLNDIIVAFKENDIFN